MHCVSALVEPCTSLFLQLSALLHKFRSSLERVCQRGQTFKSVCGVWILDCVDEQSSTKESSLVVYYLDGVLYTRYERLDTRYDVPDTCY